MQWNVRLFVSSMLAFPVATVLIVTPSLSGAMERPGSGTTHQPVLRPSQSPPGTLWGWGRNTNGELGDGSVSNKNVPEQIDVSAGRTWSQVSAGNAYSPIGAHTMAITAGGQMWAWGDNQFGQLGDDVFGAMGDSSIPQQVTPIRVGAGRPWKQVSSGYMHTVAIARDGTLWAWGRSLQGDLGIGMKVPNQDHPRLVSDAKVWASVSAGYFFTLAIQRNGSLWAWGNNGDGELGDGTRTDRYHPVPIAIGMKWRQVSAGLVHTEAIRSDGTLWAWGYNVEGQLGDGTTSLQRSPEQIGTDTTWRQVSADYYHTVAIKNDGSLWAWGCDCAYALGDPTGSDHNVPWHVDAFRWRQVSAGGSFTLAIRSDGTLWGWGDNTDGQLTKQSSAPQKMPREISPGSWLTVSAGGASTMAIQR